MTRLAVLSDIHGNSLALEAVLADVDRVGADVLVNLGDIVSGPLDPPGTMQLLRARPMVTIAGNHERNVLTTPRAQQMPSDAYASDTLGSADLDWLRDLPARAEPAPGVLAFHGSPSDDLCYLLETSTPEGLRAATDEEVVSRLATFAGGWALYLCGHTHLQRSRALPDGSLVVNPGSVGMPAFRSEVPYPHVSEAGTPHARYTIVDDSGGSWQPQPRLVDYHHDQAARTAEANGRPEVAHALRTGRMDAAG